MKKFILDTNIYGLLFTDIDFHKLHTLLGNKKEEWRVYGYDVIRKELKKAPSKTIEKVNVRASLLRAYSSFISKEYVQEEIYLEIAEDYYQQYLTAGGSLTKEKLWNDFLIVACASVKEINIVVSEDNATLASEIAKIAYKNVNSTRKIRIPDFIGYETFKNLLGGTSLSNPIINSSNKFGILLGFFHVFPFVFAFHTILKETLIYKHFVLKDDA